ncbi:MAG: MBL fold metallo-hydrolase, partial [Chloroflexi bacterium]|nr:MBL fold metallo-hydrolase [Chloroflexota bacterium]
DIVLNTHLHSDHCGGNTRREGERLLLTFPRAESWVQGEEWEDALRPNERTQTTYLAENFVPVQEAGRFRFLEGDTSVTAEVRCMLTPGHTRAHQSIVIESGGQTAIYLADLSPWAVHLERLAWIPAYDLEPLVTLETKRSLREWAQRTNALLFFEHDPRIAAGYLRPADKEFVIEPLSLGSAQVGPDSALGKSK